MSPQKTVYILVGVFEAGKLSREHLECDHHIVYPLPHQYSLVLTDVINQGLGDQIAEYVSKRVGADVEYRHIPELDREELGKQMISFSSEKVAVMLVDPSDKALTLQSIPGHNPHSSRILSHFVENGLMAYEVIKFIGHNYSSTPEQAISGAVQVMSNLDPGSVAYLINDTSREECFRHVFRAHPRAIDFAVSDCNSINSSPASPSGLPLNDSISSTPSSHIPRKRLREDRSNDSSRSRSTSTVSSRFQGSVKCDWPGCTHDAPYTTKRGLSEHLTLKHNVSEYHAKAKAITAFEPSSQPLQHLEVPTSLYGPTQTTGRHVGGQTVQRDQLYALASWTSSSTSIDSPASMVSMSPALGDRLDDSPSPGSYASTNNARVPGSPSSGLEAVTRNLLLDSPCQSQLSDGLDLTFDDATSSFVQTHFRSADPWNSHNLSQIENEGGSAFSSEIPVSGTSDSHNMSTNFTFRSGGQSTRF